MNNYSKMSDADLNSAIDQHIGHEQTQLDSHYSGRPWPDHYCTDPVAWWKLMEILRLKNLSPALAIDHYCQDMYVFSLRSTMIACSDVKPGRAICICFLRAAESGVV